MYLFFSHYSSSTTTTTRSTYVPTTTSPADYTLGSRSLTLNVYGADVKALVELLIKHHYFMKEATQTNYLGYIVYDKQVQDAVRSFQSDAGLTPDGIAGSQTITRLKTWVPKVYDLGDRLLKKGMRGSDVTQLKNILIDKGLLEKPFAKGSIVFDASLESALKAFQNSIGIDASGILDAQTLYFLKKQDD